MGTDTDNNTIQGSGPASFQIHGALHHLMGSLIPPDGLQSSYAQLNGAILLDLHTTFREINPYAPLYKQSYKIMRVSNCKLYMIYLLI